MIYGQFQVTRIPTLMLVFCFNHFVSLPIQRTGTWLYTSVSLAVICLCCCFLFRRNLTRELIWHSHSSIRCSKMVFLLFWEFRKNLYAWNSSGAYIRTYWFTTIHPFVTVHKYRYHKYSTVVYQGYTGIM